MLNFSKLCFSSSNFLTNLVKEKEESENSDGEEDDDKNDDTPCQKCGKYDHPEWVSSTQCSVYVLIRITD